MGVLKRLSLKLNNKKLYPRIKRYRFYRADIWGIMRWRRQWKYKRAILSIVRGKRKFYYRILENIYNGNKFSKRKYNYRANLFFTKRRLKLFYGILRDKQFGKLKNYFKNNRGDKLNNFFGVLERRLDVLLIRALYYRNIFKARIQIRNKNIYINSEKEFKIYKIVNVGDIISIKNKPNSFEFFPFVNKKGIDIVNKQEKVMQEFIYNIYYNDKRIQQQLSSEFFQTFLKIFKISKETYLYMFNFFERFLLFLINFFDKLCNLGANLFLRINNILSQNYIELGKALRETFLTLLYYDFNSEIIGYASLRNRWKHFFKYISSKIIDLKKNTFFRFFIKNQPLINTFKKYRFWRLSKKAFLRIFHQIYGKKKRIKFLRPSWFGFPPYIEVNYKIHRLIIVQRPTQKMIKYPFKTKTKLFFEYWNNKAFI